MSDQNVREFRHEALLYSGSEEFVAGAVPFILSGIAGGEPVLVVESLDKIEMLRVALGAEADSVLFANMAEVGANPARIIPAWHDFVARNGAGGQRLRGIGEPIWNGRSADELVECQRHESLLNVAFGRGRPWWLLCPYDKANLDASVIDEARRSHEYVSEGSASRRSEAFRGFEASGAPFDAPLPEPGKDVMEMTFSADDLSAVRAAIVRLATSAGLGSRSADLVAAVNEVCTNSIRHGGGSGTLRAWQESSKVVCEIRDGGRFTKALADRLQPSAQASGARGLWLTNQLCDLVQIRTLPGRTVVRLHMRRGPHHHHLHVVADIDEGSLNR